MTDVHVDIPHGHVHDDHHHDHLNEHDHGHSHDVHDHDHPHAKHQEHEHAHGASIWAQIGAALHLPGFAHTHDHGEIVRSVSPEDNNLAIRTVWLALLALGATTVIQVFIVVASGSVALLADTVHNLGDALNSIPLLIAFYLARRAANRRYTYGFNRAEDIAGILIVVSIAFSAAYILWESVQKLINPQPLTNLPWVAAAAIVGFIGNEIVALLQIRVGRKIGSEAMIADGLHARTDGLTSLAVLVAVAGAALGFPIVDPLVGLLIGITIVFITRDAAIAVWYRLMDAVDPRMVEQVEKSIREHHEVRAIQRLQMRWLGHQLYVEGVLELDPALSFAQSAEIADHVRHHLHHILPRMSKATISAVPWDADARSHSRESEHHRVQDERI
ncbi:MAG: cation transporter [Anaerolineae bacterium]|nr:cation transporter [Anaerolineae bacterium]